MDGPFVRDHHPVVGAAERLLPGVRVVTAGNGGPMTFTGTRTYIAGEGDVAIIDPGPDDPKHLRAVLGALAPGERVAAVLVTHAHLDHSAGAHRLAREAGAEVWARGDPAAGVRPLAAAWAEAGALGGGEGIDRTFEPDRRLRHGQALSVGGCQLVALHTPGHLGDHLCLAWEEAGVLFTGDVLMGWSTTLISPPEGDLQGFMHSLALLEGRAETAFLPGHGPPVADPKAMVRWQMNHRRERTEQILHSLRGGPLCVREIVHRVYTGLRPELQGAAGRNVLAHLLAEAEEGTVALIGTPGPDARFCIA